MQQDLTQGSIRAGLIRFSLPLIAGNLLQQLYNVADTLIVGRFLGNVALAAVGSAFSLMILLTSLVLGLCMYLRWMVRRDDRGVDFGLWRRIPMSALYLPLDVHVGETARALGLLGRRQNDWRAVEELTDALRAFDAEDPARYDFSLFGAGMDGYLNEQ